MNTENPQGNYFNTEDAGVIVRTMLYINENRPEIKNIVIDD